MNWMNISAVIWETFQSKVHHMDRQKSESWLGILDSRFCYKILIILLLHAVAVSSIFTYYISIKLYWTVVNRKIELLEKKSQLSISRVKLKIILGQNKKI